MAPPNHCRPVTSLPPQPTPAGQAVNKHDDDDIFGSGSTTESDTDSPHPDFAFKPTFYKIHRALIDEDYESSSTTEPDTDTPDANFVKITPMFYSIPTGSSTSDLSDDIFDALVDGNPSSPLSSAQPESSKNPDDLMQRAEFLVERVNSRVDQLEHEVHAQRSMIDVLLCQLSEEETAEPCQSQGPRQSRKRGRSATPPLVPTRFARRNQRPQNKRIRPQYPRRDEEHGDLDLPERTQQRGGKRPCVGMGIL
ncbi:hypothetical protein BDN72DRAFT_903682 [Pluteus cervinus]|uniref:Uncharacterized protein n=1 Tax=Pluteus cervinus TaxID=181527 RepID=A0ACD3A7U1_9AGAR|nr:hypothetical protein BDN72DRAFT_903682 [Pluteus cervinus]